MRLRGRSALASLALLALVAPARAGEKTDKPEKSATAVDLLKTADELVKQVASLRQLAVRGPIKRGVLGREAIKQKLHEQIARQYTSEQIQTEGQVLKLLGLLPENIDYEKLQLDLLMEQVAGFYDPWTKQLYIADWLPVNIQAPALAHEIAHALQDQHFDLKRFIHPVLDQGDRQMARSALVEGDGTGVMLEFASHQDLSTLPDMSSLMEGAAAGGGIGGAPMQVLQQAPEFVKQSLLFPYVSGLRFIQYVRKRHPWTKLVEIYKRPPESTEQILHPEKYFAKERPVWLKSTSLPALKGARVLHEDTFGELQTRLFLSIVGGATDAAAAAAGWGGDRLVAYQRPGETKPSVVWLTQWDTEADAKEFAAAASKAVAKVGAWASPPHGNQVLLLFGIGTELAPKVAEEAFKTWKPTSQAPPE